MNIKKVSLIGKTIKICRKHNGLTQAELGEEIGFPKKNAGVRIASMNVRADTQPNIFLKSWRNNSAYTDLQYQDCLSIPSLKRSTRCLRLICFTDSIGVKTAMVSYRCHFLITAKL